MKGTLIGFKKRVSKTIEKVYKLYKGDFFMVKQEDCIYKGIYYCENKVWNICFGTKEDTHNPADGTYKVNDS